MLNKRKKRLLLLSLSIILLISLFIAGCQQQNGNDNADNNDNQNNNNQNVEIEDEGVANSKVYVSDYKSDRTLEDYKQALIDLVDADTAGEMKFPENTKIKYPFIPLKKDGETIGYGTWTRQIIYQHAEDMIAVISPEGTVLKWKPIDANDHHSELKEEENLKVYYGMTLDKQFDPNTDVISGSTISSNTFFFELRNMLLTFKEYGPGANQEEAEKDATEESTED